MNTGQLFGQTSFIPRDGLRVVVTGQVGIDKQPFLEQVIQLAAENGIKAKLFNVGEMMYKESPDVAAGRILDLPISRLNAIRRAVFRDILAEADRTDNIIVNTHATFRWRHGLFPAFDHDLILRFAPNMFITLVDNVDSVHLRLIRDHNSDHSLKDLLVWREEEILATELMTSGLGAIGKFVVLARGSGDSASRTLFQLMFRPQTKRVYPSYPLSHVMDCPEILAELGKFRKSIEEHFIVFDPGDLEEKRLHFEALEAAERGEKFIQVTVEGQEVGFDVDEILGVARDIHAQIYARDFKLIDQSDMIISYIPQLAGGAAGLSSGVERELQHAHEATKEVYVIWRPAVSPSPFVTETASAVFTDLSEALDFFAAKGYLAGGTKIPN